MARYECSGIFELTGLVDCHYRLRIPPATATACNILQLQTTRDTMGKRLIPLKNRGGGASPECLPLPVYYWRPSPLRYGGVIHNFGDSLFPRIVERILGHPIWTVSRFYPFPKLLAGGSVINSFARDGDIVWGAGLHTSDAIKARRLDVRAVRGPLTRQILYRQWGIDCPEVYGDPALLTPDLFPEWRPMPVKGRIGLVPHLKNRKKYCDLPDHIALILPTRRPEEVLPEILRCELIISGSLHGLIIAEAYGIPARWFPDDGGEPEFKYHDYYASTGRTPHPARSLRHAEALGGQLPGVMPEKTMLLGTFPKSAITHHTEAVIPDGGRSAS